MVKPAPLKFVDGNPVTVNDILGAFVHFMYTELMDPPETPPSPVGWSKRWDREEGVTIFDISMDNYDTAELGLGYKGVSPNTKVVRSHMETAMGAIRRPGIDVVAAFYGSVNTLDVNDFVFTQNVPIKR